MGFPPRPGRHLSPRRAAMYLHVRNCSQPTGLKEGQSADGAVGLSWKGASVGRVILCGDRASLCLGRVIRAGPGSAASRAFPPNVGAHPFVSVLGLQAVPPEPGPIWMPLGPTSEGPQQGPGHTPRFPALIFEQNPLRNIPGQVLVPQHLMARPTL